MVRNSVKPVGLRLFLPRAVIVGSAWHRSRAALAADSGHGADDELLPGIAALFNGALFRASEPADEPIYA